MDRWIVRAYEPWDSHRTHNGRTEERKDKSGKWYKADEVVDLARRVLPIVEACINEDITSAMYKGFTAEPQKIKAELEQIAKEGEDGNRT